VDWETKITIALSACRKRCPTLDWWNQIQN